MLASDFLLYIVRFLHQTTTNHWLPSSPTRCISSVSYIKPQRTLKQGETHMRCISSVSYIKPQQGTDPTLCALVVYRPFPTSNHNPALADELVTAVVYRPFPTSNHNHNGEYFFQSFVVYRPFPTSNHNKRNCCPAFRRVVYRPFPTSNHNNTL